MLPQLVVPPRESEPGVCLTCRTYTDLDGECWNCTDNRQKLGVDPLPISVISLYRKPSAMRDWLTQYKGRDTEEDPLEPSYAPLVRAMMGRFIYEHGGTLHAALGPIDGLQVVPSSKSDRPPPHPLNAVVDSLLIDVPRVELIETGDTKVDWHQPSADGYRISGVVASQRILLIDDVYTTGARLNSAAYTLRGAGHVVVGALVIARRVNPEWDGAPIEAAEFWSKQAGFAYDWRSSPGLALERLG